MASAVRLVSSAIILIFSPLMLGVKPTTLASRIKRWGIVVER